MSRGLNKVQVIGHLGKDPEMRYTPSGKPVTTFSVAVSRSWNSACLLYTSPSPRDRTRYRMPSSA